MSRKPGAEAFGIFSDITKFPREIYQFDLKRVNNSSPCILSIGHWGQAHANNLYKGYTVLYFGSDVDQIPFECVQVSSLSFGDHVVTIPTDDSCNAPAKLWRVFPPSSDHSLLPLR